MKLGRRTYSMSVMVLIFEQLPSLTLNVLGVQVARGVADRIELARVGLDLIFLAVDGCERHEVRAVRHRVVTRESEVCHLFLFDSFVRKLNLCLFYYF